ncbi:hypothetical protein CRN78_13015 [Klebsiella aerogenes]|nr:hypothetical protein CRN78_13015 [Klebsiella aerogenes]
MDTIHIGSHNVYYVKYSRLLTYLLWSCPDDVRYDPLSRNNNDNIQRRQREYYSLPRQFPNYSILVMGDSRVG